MLIKTSSMWIVILNVAGWPLVQLGLAWLFTRMPAAWFDPPSQYDWEQNGRFYEIHFGIKRWKDRLPDAAVWFGGGFAKGSLAGHDPAYLRRFIRETWRGELCHWSALGCAPVFFLWNPWWADLVMVGYAVMANIPCILAQRYNRLRLLHLLANRLRRDDHLRG